MTPEKSSRHQSRAAALPRLSDVLADKTQDPDFAAVFDETLAALRLGLALCEAREGLGLTQQEIEARTGVPQETLSRIERGRMPSLTTLHKIARALGVQVVVRPDDTVSVEPFTDRKAA